MSSLERGLIERCPTNEDRPVTGGVNRSGPERLVAALSYGLKHPKTLTAGPPHPLHHSPRCLNGHGAILQNAADCPVDVGTQFKQLRLCLDEDAPAAGSRDHAVHR